jgi:5-methylcytosine-specific restriction endonuclease McrA
MKHKFFKTHIWKKLASEVLSLYSKRCLCCGSDTKIIVSHIKPRKKYPELSLDINNLQPLCEDCHIGKQGNRDETDFRKKESQMRLIKRVKTITTETIETWIHCPEYE